MNAVQEDIQFEKLEKELDLEEAIALYGNALLRLCFFYLKDRMLAEDAVQDTFIKAYKSFLSFRGESSLKTWLTRIAINVCKDYLKKSKIQIIDDERALMKIPCSDTTEFVSEKENIVLEIMKLAPKYKDVILLYYYQEFTIPEISKILKMPTGTVSTRLKRGRQKLKEHLKEWYYDEE